jgi:hypothetical protein
MVNNLLYKISLRTPKRAIYLYKSNIISDQRHASAMHVAIYRVVSAGTQNIPL